MQEEWQLNPLESYVGNKILVRKKDKIFLEEEFYEEKIPYTLNEIIGAFYNLQATTEKNNKILAKWGLVPEGDKGFECFDYVYLATSMKEFKLYELAGRIATSLSERVGMPVFNPSGVFETDQYRKSDLDFYAVHYAKGVFHLMTYESFGTISEDVQALLQNKPVIIFPTTLEGTFDEDKYKSIKESPRIIIRGEGMHVVKSLKQGAECFNAHLSINRESSENEVCPSCDSMIHRPSQLYGLY
jgi:hypothetical protein